LKADISCATKTGQFISLLHTCRNFLLTLSLVAIMLKLFGQSPTDIWKMNGGLGWCRRMTRPAGISATELCWRMWPKKVN